LGENADLHLNGPDCYVYGWPSCTRVRNRRFWSVAVQKAERALRCGSRFWPRAWRCKYGVMSDQAAPETTHWLGEKLKSW